MRMDEHGFGRKGLRKNFRAYEPGYGSIQLKNITDRINLGELQVDNI